MDLQESQSTALMLQTFNSPFYVDSLFNSLDCSLMMGQETSPFVILEIIREARRYSTNIRMVRERNKQRKKKKEATKVTTL